VCVCVCVCVCVFQVDVFACALRSTSSEYILGFRFVVISRLIPDLWIKFTDDIHHRDIGTEDATKSSITGTRSTFSAILCVCVCVSLSLSLSP